MSRPTISVDVYGNGGEVALLEQEVAELLGKPAAVFLPTGILAQQGVLRVYADRAGTQPGRGPRARRIYWCTS